jgi:hypothetical protein
LIEGRYFEGNKMLIFLYFELINLWEVNIENGL